MGTNTSHWRELSRSHSAFVIYTVKANVSHLDRTITFRDPSEGSNQVCTCKALFNRSNAIPVHPMIIFNYSALVSSKQNVVKHCIPSNNLR